MPTLPKRCHPRPEVDDRRTAILDFTQSIKIKPHYRWADRYRGIDLHYSGNRQEAIDDFTNAIQLTPNHAYGDRLRGEVLIKLDNRQAAIDDDTQAAKLSKQQG